MGELLDSLDYVDVRATPELIEKEPDLVIHAYGADTETEDADEQYHAARTALARRLGRTQRARVLDLESGGAA